METITFNDQVQSQISDTEKARQLKRQNPNMTAKEIAARIGRKATYVYAALRFAKDIPHPKRGRPRKAKKVVKPVISQEKPRTLDDILALPKQAAKDDWQIKSLEGEIANLKVVIRYLEGKLYGAPV